jgi:hypothetical protein
MTRAIEQNDIAENESFVVILDSGKSMLPEGYAVPYFAGEGESDMEYGRR